MLLVALLVRDVASFLTCNMTKQSLKGLYSELTPDVEAQVAAIEQEKARLNQSLDYVREELEKVDVSKELEENLKATQAALERAKAQVRARACVCARDTGKIFVFPCYRVRYFCRLCKKSNRPGYNAIFEPNTSAA